MSNATGLIVHGFRLDRSVLVTTRKAPPRFGCKAAGAELAVVPMAPPEDGAGCVVAGLDAVGADGAQAAASEATVALSVARMNVRRFRLWL
ncbi:MAG: hypothetical protein NVSMB2_17920 [Chloroflexota bacterium]